MQPEDGADRQAEEPGVPTQQDQLDALREEGDHPDVWFDMTEEEEARILEAEHGPPDADGIYRGSEAGEGG
jgi:hypothetical protein